MCTKGSANWKIALSLHYTIQIPGFGIEFGRSEEASSPRGPYIGTETQDAAFYPNGAGVPLLQLL